MAAAPVVGALIGQQTAAADRDAARQAYEEALAQYKDLNLPDLKDLNLTNYSWLGDFNPALEQAIDIGPSEEGQIALNPEIRAQKMAALADLHARALTGLTPAEEARYAQNYKDAGALARAATGQIDLTMGQRGQLGSGSNYASQMAAIQNAANRAQDLAIQTSIQRDAQRMLGADKYLSGLTQQSQEEFNAASKAAQARDMFARINNAQQNAAQQRNIASQNLFGMQNQQGRQNTANQNTQLANQQQMYNLGGKQQQMFENQLRLAQGKARAFGGYGGQMDRRAADTAGMWAELGQGIGGAVGAYNQQQTPQNNTMQIQPYQSPDSNLNYEFGQYTPWYKR